MREVVARWAPGAARPAVQHPAAARHWTRSDPGGDVLAVAWAPGLAPPREIRVRPELYVRILTALDPAVRATVLEHRALGEPAEVPLVVDPELPPCPGFEVVRVRPARPRRLRRSA